MKKCSKNNCNNLINFNKRFCDEHKELNNQSQKDYDSMRYERDKTYIRFYNSKSWKTVRHNVMLRDDWLCQICLRKGLYTKGDVVDHIIELRDDYSKRLENSNLECLCHDCHNKKTYREKQRRLENKK